MAALFDVTAPAKVAFFLGAAAWFGATTVALPVPGAVGYPVAVFLSWALNLAIAELWLRRGEVRIVAL